MDGLVNLFHEVHNPPIDIPHFNTAVTLALAQSWCDESVSHADTDCVQTPLSFTARTHCTVRSSCPVRLSLRRHVTQWRQERR